MYSITVPESSSGIKLYEFLDILKDTDSFVQKIGSGFSENTHIVLLDDRIIVSSALRSTVVSAGQSVKVFHVAYGG